MSLFNNLKSIVGRKKRKLVPNPLDSDVYLISFPKSGNTWLRYLLAYSIWPERAKISMEEMARLIPSYSDTVQLNDKESPCNSLSSRIIKEHCLYTEALVQAAQIKKVIYLCRDGRDAVLSYWHFCNQRDGSKVSFSNFIKSSAKKEMYGPWAEHINGWVNQYDGELLIVKYEDMLLDPAKELKKVLVFSGFLRSDAIIDSAVDKASFKSLKKMEKKGGFNKGKLTSINFFREGRSGSWEKEYSEECIKEFYRYHGGNFPLLGYTLIEKSKDK